MTGDLRKDWQKAKKDAERHGVSGDFFSHADLGPKLDKAEKAWSAYDDYSGGDPDKTDKLAKAAAKSISAAEKAAAVYAKNVRDAKRHAEDRVLRKAFDDLETVLAFKIIHPLGVWAKQVKRAHA